MSRETLNFCKDYDNQLKEEEKNHLVENTTSIQRTNKRHTTERQNQYKVNTK